VRKHNIRDEAGLEDWIDSRKAQEQDSLGGLTFPKNELAEIFVRGYQEPTLRKREGQNLWIRHAGPKLGDIGDIEAECPESFDDLAIDTLVREKVHPTVLGSGRKMSE
jgi:hypothetical protein